MLQRPPHAKSPARALVAILTAAALVMAACGSSGRELRPPPEGVTAPPRSTTIVDEPTGTVAPETDPDEETTTTEAAGMTLASPAWSGDEALPATFTCDGEDISPPLAWSGVTAGVSSLAVTVVDPDDGFVHWLVVGLDPAQEGFAAGTLPEGAEVLPNGAGEAEWLGPCPAEGETSEYVIRLLAFSESPSLPEAPAPEMVAALDEAAEDAAQMVVRYERAS